MSEPKAKRGPSAEERVPIERSVHPTANPATDPAANPTANPTTDPTANPPGNPTTALAGALPKMLAWGLLWAALGALTLYVLAHNPWPIQSSRATELRASLTVLDHGGPALLGYEPGTHKPYAIGYSDDQGIYAIVPPLSHWLGQSDPLAVLRWMWILAWALTLLSSAVVFRALFHSSWAGLLAPPTMLVCILSFGFGDIYWVAAWVVVTFMPPLILLLRRRPRLAWLALVAIALVAGAVTAIRSDAGLPVALAAVAVAVLAGGRRWLRAVTVAAVALAYLAPTSIALPAIRSHRDSRIGVNLSASAPTSHPLWHTLYVGLGYTSNRYGIHYSDGYAAAAAQEADPGVRYLSPAYSSVLHRQIDVLLEHDPGFVATAEAQKAVVELFQTAPYILLLALLLPAALTAQGAARLRPLELALFIPALALGALPAIVGIPIRDYELSLLAPLGVLGLLTIGSAAARTESQWTAARTKSQSTATQTKNQSTATLTEGQSTATHAQGEWATAGATAVGLADRTRLALHGAWVTWPRRTTLQTLLVAVAVLAPTFLFARHLEAEHERWDRGERNPPRVVLAAAPTGAPPA